MSFGIPTIGVDQWAMPELIRDRKNGFLIPYNSINSLIDRMSQLSQDPFLLQEMGNSARFQFQDFFSIDHHNRRLSQIYLEAIESNNINF